MRKSKSSQSGFNACKGSLTIEAAVILPFMMILIYMMILLPLSEIAFDDFEEALHTWLVESVNHTLQAEEVMDYLTGIEHFELSGITWKSGEITLEIKFAGIRSRRWRITYPFSRIPFERLVYVTDTGRKFHIWGCIHLRESLIPIIYSRALLEYAPCKVCSLKS